MTIRLETTCEQCGTTVHSLAYGYSDHFSRNMWHLQCSACGRLTTEQPFDWGDFPASPQQSVITWVPVSDRLPEDGGIRFIIVATDPPYYELGLYDEHSGVWLTTRAERISWRVDRWAELPPIDPDAGLSNLLDCKGILNTPPVSEEGEG